MKSFLRKYGDYTLGIIVIFLFTFFICKAAYNDFTRTEIEQCIFNNRMITRVYFNGRIICEKDDCFDNLNEFKLLKCIRYDEAKKILNLTIQLNSEFDKINCK